MNNHKITHAIQNASHRAFNAFTKPSEPAKHRRAVNEFNADEPSPETMRQRESTEPANKLGALRYQVTDGPTYNARDAISWSSHETHVFAYAEFKLNAIYSTGAYSPDMRIPDLYVWDLNAPRGTLNPIARFHYNELTHEVERT